ncbi:hypothetical protein L198_04300 [Cryptococcus wingfieldii CBS 7118]|uniref:MARVEL domain-containing protein n=1 Tax=Cryptococcus wingfieldii CBS 7118 TaxID=1295528 RepID=A0A1E3J6V9_9TREE|nr:hypothetical protein L198_04300 [Cryptococcus wingfieldii CBS 7118]ODN96584.1 hypothetical protein L198_04300 [Cryptococcus wingfieldii CBS 7118]
MSSASLVSTGLKAFACFWAALTFSVAAGFIAKTDDFFTLLGGSKYVRSTHLTAGNALIAAGVLAWLLVLTFVSPRNICVSVMVDTICLFALFVFFLGSSATLSTLASLARAYDTYTWAKLGEATLGIAWVMTFLILGILIFQVAYALLNFGGSYATWRSSFSQLVSRPEEVAPATPTTEKEAISAEAPVAAVPALEV